MTDPSQIIADALALPSEHRALLAEKLLESLDFNEDFGVSEAWLQEIHRRVEQLDRAETTTATVEDAMERARAGLRR